MRTPSLALVVSSLLLAGAAGAQTSHSDRSIPLRKDGGYSSGTGAPSRVTTASGGETEPSSSGATSSGSTSSGTVSGGNVGAGTAGAAAASAGSMRAGSVSAGSMSAGAMTSGTTMPGSSAGSAASGTGMAGSTAGTDSGVASASPGASSSMSSGMTASAGSAAFTDPRIAAVASAANVNEIEPSQVALTQAQNAGVRDYARMMVDAHTRLDQQMHAMLSAEGLAPEDNPLSWQIKQMTPAAVDSLRKLSGAAFDRAYVADMVMSHQMTLQALDNQLIPSARDPQLKAMLQQTVRPAVVDHLQRATALRDEVANAR